MTSRGAPADRLRVSPLDWLHASRDRLVASEAFRRRMARFPLTRFIARRRAKQAFDLCAGFVYSQVLLACVRCGLLEALAERPQTLPVVARRTGLELPAAQRLLSAAAALRLVERRAGERYGLGDLGAAFAADGAVKAMVEHNALLYADLADPLALLRGQPASTRLRDYWGYGGSQDPATLAPERVAPYSALMAASQALVREEVLASYSFAGHRCLLDVGGGQGEFIRALAAKHASLRFQLFDLPAVAGIAAARLEASGLAGRTQVVGGDFFTQPLPRGADAATLLRILHDHDDAHALRLLRAVRDALPEGGTVLIAEPLAGTPGAEAVGDAYFGFYLLAMGSGRARTFAEMRALLTTAQFADVRRHRTALPLQTSVVTAKVMAPSVNKC